MLYDKRKSAFNWYPSRRSTCTSHNVSGAGHVQLDLSPQIALKHLQHVLLALLSLALPGLCWLSINASLAQINRSNSIFELWRRWNWITNSQIVHDHESFLLLYFQNYIFQLGLWGVTGNLIRDIGRLQELLWISLASSRLKFNFLTSLSTIFYSTMSLDW